MLWHKKQRAEDLTSNIKLNDRILLDLRDSRYMSRVEDVRENQIHIAAPLERGTLITAKRGEQINVSLFTEKGLRRLSAKVMEVIPGLVPVFVIANLADLGILQRREYDRVGEMMLIRYRPDSRKGFEEPWNNATSNDISAGGLRMEIKASDTIIKLDDIIEVELRLPDEGTCTPLCKVVRVAPIGTTAGALLNIGLCFVQIEPADRDKVHSYIKQKQMEIRGERRKFVRLWPSHHVPVHYKAAGIGLRRPNWIDGLVIDLSTGGLRMRVDDASGFSVGNPIDMSVDLPGGRISGIKCEIIRVVRGDSIQRPYSVIGVRFTKMSDSNSRIIEQFLCHLPGAGQTNPSKAA